MRVRWTNVVPAPDARWDEYSGWSPSPEEQCSGTVVGYATRPTYIGGHWVGHETIAIIAHGVKLTAVDIDRLTIAGEPT